MCDVDAVGRNEDQGAAPVEIIEIALLTPKTTVPCENAIDRFAIRIRFRDGIAEVNPTYGYEWGLHEGRELDRLADGYVC